VRRFWPPPPCGASWRYLRRLSEKLSQQRYPHRKNSAAFVSHHGFVRAIFDFSSVQANAVPQSFLVWRARLPQILLGQERVIVAPQQEIYELACAYAVQQRDFGNVVGQIVRALDDAYRLLDLEQADFRPVESVYRPEEH
jgi:hypothetical protein